MILDTLKKLFSWLSIGTFASAIPLSFSPSAHAQNFRDIQDHWAQECIQNLAAQGIVAGYPNNTFQPRGVITRAEYAAMMNQAFPNISPERQPKNFIDVSDDYWGQEAIRTAYRNGFLSGYPNDEFRPENLIVREEAFVALVSGLDYSIPNNPEQILNQTYQDAANIADYAEGKIAAATQNNILISPPKPQFDQRLMGPNDPATRGQIAVAICQAKNIEGVPNRYVVTAPSPDRPLANLNLVQTLTGHSRGIMSVEISPDGQTLVSGGDNTVKIWDLSTGELQRTLRDHSEWVYSVDVSPDSRRIASGSVDNTVKIWNLQTGELLHNLTGHSDSVIDIDISPGGGLVASGSDDETIKVWDLGTGELLRTFTGHTDPVNAVAISPDGETVVSGSFDGTIKVWNWRRVEDNDLLRTLSGHSGGVHAVAIAPDGQTLISGGQDNTIKIWNLETGELRRTLTAHSGRVDSLAVSADGEILVSGALDETVKVWELSTGQVINTLTGITSPAVDIGGDGTTLVSGSGSPVIANEEVVVQVWKPQSE
ncbi:S-layer homology domain-containing protein [Coleofasciculus sp.]|uniref:S-layer homology domain-containing protein n=1 Tax=Coleofasciculus sp. TaxID=3100458 RepID=UPI003A4AF078